MIDFSMTNIKPKEPVQQMIRKWPTIQSKYSDRNYRCPELYKLLDCWCCSWFCLACQFCQMSFLMPNQQMNADFIKCT